MSISGESENPVTPQEKRASAENALPLNYARTFSWLSLLFILLTSLFLSFFIASSVRDTLLRRQADFTQLLVENLNSQIFRRFAVPTLLAGGSIRLREPSQYERLDNVVRSVIAGLPVEKMRIFDFSHLVAYSTEKEELGNDSLAPINLDSILDGSTIHSEIVSNISPWEAWFHIPLDPGTFSVRVLYPLRGEIIGAEHNAPIMGALELTQDITDDYEKVMALQGIIVVMCLLSSVILFGAMLVLIHRAERVIEDRIQKNHKLENEIHSNEKLVSMGRVVASIAHEIRNPLGIIRSSAELLQRRAAGADPTSSRILGAIYDESVRLSQTVNDFLDYARPRQPRHDLVDVSLIIAQALSFLEGEFKRHGVTVSNSVQPKLLVYGDKDLLYRAFYNILVNSQQAMSGSGEIKISSSIQAIPDETDHKKTAAWAEVSFQDSGPGFDPAAINKILDPFFTTKDHGTGLGLPIVQAIVTAHGGRLELESADPAGALVRIWLPYAEAGGENPK